MPQNTERFSNRVENYVKYRPGYPPEVLELFRTEMSLTPQSVIADVGSGTGISARIFLENGNAVFGVEPNGPMRKAAEAFLRNFPAFHSIDGTAEATGLDDDSVDFVVAAQAFHWFGPEQTGTEFRRILRPGGHIALIWNERWLEGTAFHVEYERLIREFATDYEKVRHDRTDEERLTLFFGGQFRSANFKNEQVLDFDGLKGRLLSSSYMPAENDPLFEPMVAELRSLFANHAENGRIEVFYNTKVFYTRI